MSTGTQPKGEEDAAITASSGKPPSARSKRSFEEDAEDEDGARLRRRHLVAVATSKDIRDTLLGDERILNTVLRIDATDRAEEALDEACEDPAFRKFTEKILDRLEEASK